MQKGQLIQASGSIYIRFYRDGKRVAEKLCAVDDKHYSTKAKAVKILAAEFMLKENKAPAGPRATVAEFWDKEFVPYIDGALKPSTCHGYRKLWESTLKNHFDGQFLADYKTRDGSALLTSLAPKLSPNSLAHVRGLASSVFSLAVNKGLIDRNPWREVKALAKPKTSKPTGHYSIEEVKDALEKLSGRSKTAFGLCFWLALRPGELRALRWEDFSGGFAHIGRSAWRGHVGTTKTEESAQKVPLSSQASELLEEWRGQCGGAREGFLFQNARGNPLDVAAITRPMAKALGQGWKALYSARRGAGTALTELTGSALAAQRMLRHKSLATTLAHYKKDTPAETLRGMRIMEAKAKD
jgi:integrase